MINHSASSFSSFGDFSGTKGSRRRGWIRLSAGGSFAFSVGLSCTSPAGFNRTSLVGESFLRPFPPCCVMVKIYTAE